MSYLVEQPPHCDLLRLSLSTSRFVRFRRASRRETVAVLGVGRHTLSRYLHGYSRRVVARVQVVWAVADVRKTLRQREKDRGESLPATAGSSALRPLPSVHRRRGLAEHMAVCWKKRLVFFFLSFYASATGPPVVEAFFFLTKSVLDLVYFSSLLDLVYFGL